MCALPVSPVESPDPDPAFSGHGWLRWRVRMEDRLEEVCRRLADVTRRLDEQSVLLERGRGALWAGKALWALLGTVGGAVATIIGYLMRQ